MLLTFRKNVEPGVAYGILADFPVPHDVRERVQTDDGLNEAIDEAWGTAVVEEYRSDVR